MKKRKAQAISINTIVVAAIALIVLVVIIAIFGGRIKIFSSGAQDCGTQGGECKADCAAYGESQGGIYTNVPGTNCEPDRKCCIPIIPPNPE